MQLGPADSGARRPAVVVVGCGFGGLATLRTLSGRFQAICIDKNIYATFQPLLYQVATAGLAPSDVAYPIRGVARKYGARFRAGEMIGVDVESRVVSLADGSTIGYDYLILATGVTAGYFGIEGAAEHTFGLYTRRDAIRLRDELMGRLERLSAESGRLAVTIVGGGATGVEMAGSLAELRNIALRTAYPEIDRTRVTIRLIERLPDLLTPFEPSLRGYARTQLARRGVEVRTGTAISKLAADRLVLDNGEVLPSDLTVWAAGVRAAEQVGSWGLPQGQAGRLLVAPDLRVVGHERVFAVGDAALTAEWPLPQLAQPALQMGRHAASQISRLEAGLQTVPFGYRDKGIMATIGRRSAVVQLPTGPSIRGTLAWLAWLVLHLLTLLGNRNRISALINLASRYITWGHTGGLIVGEHQMSDAADDGRLPADRTSAAGS